MSLIQSFSDLEIFKYDEICIRYMKIISPCQNKNVCFVVQDDIGAEGSEQQEVQTQKGEYEY